MKNTKIIFMGTPIFACGILQTLLEEKYNVVAVVSQPDKKVGRKQILTPTPVKSLALENNIPVIQPNNIKDDYQAILEYKPDLIVTCAYGQIVPEIVLNAPKNGCINVHASLLPKYRGGAPIHKAIMNGEKETGVTIMQMVKKMDAGLMYAKKTVQIGPDETTEELHDALVLCGKELLKESLPLYLDGKLIGEPQDDSLVSFAWNISKEEEYISFQHEDIDVLYNHIRGLISWPVGYGVLEGKRVKLHKVRKECKNTSANPGTILGFTNDYMEVACMGGVLQVYELQLEGKAKTNAKEFFNGYGKECIGKCFE